MSANPEPISRFSLLFRTLVLTVVMALISGRLDLNRSESLKFSISSASLAGWELFSGTTAALVYWDVFFRRFFTFFPSAVILPEAVGQLTNGFI